MNQERATTAFTVLLVLIVAVICTVIMERTGSSYRYYRDQIHKRAQRSQMWMDSNPHVWKIPYPKGPGDPHGSAAQRRLYYQTHPQNP